MKSLRERIDALPAVVGLAALCKCCRVSYWTARRWIADGRLPAPLYVGRSPCWPKEQLVAALRNPPPGGRDRLAMIAECL